MILENGPQVGNEPPPLCLSDVVQGPALEEITWQKLKGQVVVMEFWNTRCAGCIQAIPHLNELINEFRSRSVVFLSISQLPVLIVESPTSP